jgi:hypothetical protein
MCEPGCSTKYLLTRRTYRDTADLKTSSIPLQSGAVLKSGNSGLINAFSRWEFVQWQFSKEHFSPLR